MLWQSSNEADFNAPVLKTVDVSDSSRQTLMGVDTR